MTFYDWCGYAGSLLSSITFVPQVFRVWKTRSAGDLSMAMLLIVFSSTLIWIVYGVGIHSWPVILCNSIIAVLSLLLIYFKISFKK